MDKKPFALSNDFNVDRYINDSQLFETLAITVSEMAHAAIVQKRTSQFIDDFQSIAKSFEKISNKLKISEDQNGKCYMFGKIVSLYELVYIICNEQQEIDNFKYLVKSYPLLLPVLEEIDKHGTISGVQLKATLSNKSSSSFSNFLRRISKYELINARKYGNTNYYSLSARGKEILDSNQQEAETTEDQIPINYLYYILNGIAKELAKTKPNKLSILNPQVLALKEKMLLKFEIDKIFSARDIYFRNLLINDAARNDRYGFEEYDEDKRFDYISDINNN